MKKKISGGSILQKENSANEIIADSIAMLQELGKENGFEVYVVPKLTKRTDENENDDAEAEDREISST